MSQMKENKFLIKFIIYYFESSFYLESYDHINLLVSYFFAHCILDRVTTQAQ